MKISLVHTNGKKECSQPITDARSSVVHLTISAEWW
jgi:hypothetical protein